MAGVGSAKVLVLGAGLVVPPLVQYLNKHGYHQTIATRTPSKGEAIKATVATPDNVVVVKFDIEEEKSDTELEKLIKDSDLVISLLPYIYHVQAAKIAIKHKKNYCTASYVSKEMEQLDESAKEAGIILLNECGVDPGLDHMSAMRIIDQVHAKGGKVIGFRSLCGGLPSPAHNTNPWGYKLSWSPRGVLLASKNSAKYLEDGEEVNVEGKDLFGPENVKLEDINSHGIKRLEWYLNRDSVGYRDIYRIPEVRTLIRGTYRYSGWSRLLKAIGDLGLTSVDELKLAGLTYHEAAQKMLGDQADPKAYIAETLQIEPHDEIIGKLEWLGLFSSEDTVPDGVNTSLDVLCTLTQARLVYLEGEKDMLCMRHEFQVEYAANKRECLTSTLIDFGQQPDGNSSMARTVCLPLAVAVRKILEKEITLTGVQRPVVPELYDPILDEMEELGVKFIDEVEPVQIHVRAEVKPGEERVPLTPEDCKAMVGAQYEIIVEKSDTRCFSDDEYRASGCTLVEAGSWPKARQSTIILGLKELPDEPRLLPHRHVFFAHCFKNQGGWEDSMRRFTESHGKVWDLEFLTDDSGRRVAAFGRPAGVNGTAVGIMAWCRQQTGKQPLESLSSWPSIEAMVESIKAELAPAVEIYGKKPRVHVLGALGRCGRGATWLAEQVGLETVRWDLEETKPGGPFKELLDSEICVNAIYLIEEIEPFLLTELLDTDSRKLSVLVDVSCDMSNPANPVPVYNQETTFVNPVLTVNEKTDSRPAFEVVAIDHLPSLTPKESSEGFSRDLLPTLLRIRDLDLNPVWRRAEDKFDSVRDRL